MKKAEELVLYTPKPVRPNLDARLCVSVAEGEGQGRYIKGKTLTVAVWDKCKNPVVTWRFCGDYWIGELRKKPENNFKKDFSPKGIWERRVKSSSGQMFQQRAKIPNACMTISTTTGKI